MAISTDLLELAKKDSSVQALKLLLENISDKYDLSPEELLQLIGEKTSSETKEKQTKQRKTEIITERETQESTENKEITKSVTEKQKQETLTKETENKIPLQIFKNTKLSCLEIITKYLKENKEKTYSQIAKLLNRNDRTIWSTYSNSKKKQIEKFVIKSYTDLQPENHAQKILLKKSLHVYIPLEIFSSRKTSILESLIIYLKDKLGFSFTEISELLNKDYQTIYTTYRRGVKK